MRLRYWTALLVLGGVASFVSMKWDRQPQNQAALPVGPSVNPHGDDASTDAASTERDQVAEPAVAAVETPVEDKDAVTWTRVVGAGDSLSALLAEAGLDTVSRTDVTRAIGSEYDLRHLKPGHVLALSVSADGVPQSATLEIEDGTQILATFGPEGSVQRMAPDLDSVQRAGDIKVKSSIYAALDEAGIPTRFATDLELVLAGAFDLRTALSGGERIRLLWREFSSGDREVGEPAIDFAQLDLSDGSYEILWPDDNSTQTRIFKDGQLLQMFDQPIRGARLSSGFGRRMHPVHGNVRMHSGVDFAASQGAIVEATRSGKIAFMGARSGYGALVEIEHEGGVRTLYAHLSALNEALKVGQRVPAGTEIGRVGSTGTSTAPHLHYEIHIDGRPVSPLSDAPSRGPANRAAQAEGAQVIVDSMQRELDRLLASRG